VGKLSSVGVYVGAAVISSVIDACIVVLVVVRANQSRFYQEKGEETQHEDSSCISMCKKKKQVILTREIPHGSVSWTKGKPTSALYFFINDLRK